jgi:hypothetical protein
MSAPAVPARAVSGRTGRPAAGSARRLACAAAFLLVFGVLFVAYLRLSKTYPENSDQANILLMASDLAHGNLVLSGWTVSDVPFITTELPEIALLVRLFGLHLNTAHIAAALTYTVVLATAMLLSSSGGTAPGAPLSSSGGAIPCAPRRGAPLAKGAIVSGARMRTLPGTSWSGWRSCSRSCSRRSPASASSSCCSPSATSARPLQ